MTRFAVFSLSLLSLSSAFAASDMQGMDHSQMGDMQSMDDGMMQPAAPTESRTPIPKLTDADRAAVFTSHGGHQVHDSVINQGLFYLDWLVNSKGEFRLLVQDKLGSTVAASIDWASPRLICIAAGFTHYDTYAVQQISRSIELVRYKRYGQEHLMLELVNTPLTVTTPAVKAISPVPPTVPPVPDADGTVPGVAVTAETALQKGSPELIERYRTLAEYLQGLGDDVQVKTLKLYFAFKRLKNFVTVVPGSSKNELWLYLKLDPATVQLEDNFSRDVRTIGHWGTGDLELTIRTDADLEKAKPLLLRSYEQS